MVFSGVGTPLGWVLVGVGGTLTLADWVTGVGYDAPEIGRETGKAILKKKIENAGGLSAKELQEMDIIPPNDQLKAGKLTNNDLRELGLK